MDELYMGLVVVILVVFTIKTMNTYHNYKQTIYPQIYSGFFEFLYRKASVKRLSTSSWLESNFGKHRVLYYVDQNNKRKTTKLFVILIMSSGITIINSKNLKGQLILDKNKKYKYTTSFINKETKEYGNRAITIADPIVEIKNFTEKIEKLTDQKNISQIIQFLNDTTFNVDKTTIPFICSKDFFTTIQEIHTKNGSPLSEPEIERIYSLLIKRLQL